MKYSMLLFFSALAFNLSAKAAAPHERLMCDDDGQRVEHKLVGDVLQLDNGQKFNLSAKAKEVLLDTTRDITNKMRSLTAQDLMDKNDSSTTIVLRGGWTGMRVSFDLTLTKNGQKIARLNGCSHAPWTKGGF